MPGEEGGQIQDDSDHGRRDGGQGGRELELAPGRLDQGAAGDDEPEAGQEGEEGRHRRPGQTGGAGGAQDGLGDPAHIAHPGDDHDERPRRGFPQRQAVHHLGSRQPAEVFHRPLIDIGQDGVGAPNGEEGGLEEEGAHVEEIAAAPQGQQRGGADDDKDQGGHHQLAPGEPGVRRGRGVIVDQGRAVLLGGGTVTTAALELGRQQLAAEGPEEARGEHDPGKANVEKEDADEGQGGDAAQQAILDRPRPDAPGGEEDHRDHGGFDEMEDALHRRHLAEIQIDARQ